MAAVAIYGCGSRSSLVAVLATGVTWLVGRNIRKITKARLAWASLAIIVVVVTGGVLVSQLQSLITGRNLAEISSTAARGLMWVNAAPWISKGALIGYGDGKANLLAGLKNAGGGATIDDFYLSVILQSGFAGLVSFAAFAGCVAWLAISGIRRFADPRSSELCVTILALVACILSVQEITSITNNVAFIYLAGGILAGLRIEERMAASLPKAVLRPAPNPRAPLRALDEGLGDDADWRRRRLLPRSGQSA
jgi:O-antigen ligase